MIWEWYHRATVWLGYRNDPVYVPKNLGKSQCYNDSLSLRFGDKVQERVGLLDTLLKFTETGVQNDTLGDLPLTEDANVYLRPIQGRHDRENENRRIGGIDPKR